MASDFYIHIADEAFLTEDFASFDEVLRYFFSSVIGSKYFDPNLPDKDPCYREKYDKAWEIVESVPSVFVGEVNWFSVTLNILAEEEDPYKDIPPPVLHISRLFGDDELVLIDDKFIEKVKEALNLPNHTKLRCGDPDEIVSFLEKHKGKQCFVVSW